MVQKYLSGANVVDLSGRRGNGPFRTFLGVCLHVNVDEHGTPISFWENNPGEVTPNFQVFKNGHIDQLLPFNWQPWCQVNGNFNYAAIETAGLPSEPLTAEQIESIARILRVYHTMGMPYSVANTPGQRGLITHKAGGGAWGGHACPGDIRTAQRKHILSVAAGHPQPGGPVLHRRWPTYMPPGHYFGLESGPVKSHGGYHASEMPDVLAIQERLGKLGYYNGHDTPGKFRDDTFHAVKAWQRIHMPGTQFYGQVWSDDWRKLFTY